MAKWDVDKLTCQKCKERSDEVQAAVAAAYEKAAVAAVDYVNAFLNAEEWTTCGVYNHITALITPDARAALDRATAAAIRKGGE